MNQMTRREIYKECLTEFNLDPELVDEYVVSKNYDPLIDGDPDEEVAEDDIAEIRAEWMPIIADWVNAAKKRRSNFVLPHVPDESRTGMTRREICRQVSGEFGIHDEVIERLLDHPDSAADEELSEDEAKHSRAVWMQFFANKLAEKKPESKRKKFGQMIKALAWMTAGVAVAAFLIAHGIHVFHVMRGGATASAHPISVT